MKRPPCLRLRGNQKTVRTVHTSLPPSHDTPYSGVGAMQLIARLIGCALPPRYRCGGPRFGQTTGVLLASPRRTAARPAIKMVKKIYLKGFRRRTPSPTLLGSICNQLHARQAVNAGANLRQDRLRWSAPLPTLVHRSLRLQTARHLRSPRYPGAADPSRSHPPPCPSSSSSLRPQSTYSPSPSETACSMLMTSPESPSSRAAQGSSRRYRTR